MDILTEIYRIKQVMGLITEQAVKKTQGSFNSTTGDAAHNFNEFESKIDAALSEFYDRGINPKIQSIEVTISKINDNSFKTTYSADIGESNDGKAWMGFTSRGSYGATYVQRANGQIDGTNNEDGRTLDEKLKSIGAVDIEKIYTYHNPDVPVLQYFYQFTKEDKKPHPTNNQATIQSVRDTSQVVNTTTPQNAPNTNNTQVTTATSTPTATASVNTGVLIADTLKEGQPGDPYVYIKNEDGDFLTYKCGKTNERCLELSTNLYSVPWINVTKKLAENPTSDKYKNAEEAIKISIYKEDSPSPAEETEPEETTPTPTKQNILNKFRDYYYSTYLWYIKSSYSAEITRKPVKPTYKGQIKLGSESVEINLVGDVSSTPPGITVGAQLFTKIMDNFKTKKVNVDGIEYELKAYNTDAILPASSIFKRDTTGYVGDIKAENEIKSRKLGIYKVE